MKLFFGNDFIEFFCFEELWDVIPKPVPAYKLMPDWFKKIPPTTNKLKDSFGCDSSTAKRCMPLLDAMSLGWTIPLSSDTNVRVSDDGRYIEAGQNPITKVIEFHDINQLGGNTSPTYPGPAVKFINHWFVKTKPGYSCLFVPPLNHVEPRFTCLSGVVDTDVYPRVINFPAIWHAKGYNDRLKAGTPLVTVIPFKRSDMKKNVNVRPITKKERELNNRVEKMQLSRLGVYSHEQREPRK